MRRITALLFAALVAVTAAPSAPAQAQAPASDGGGQQVSSADLDKLTAPIALYPDALVVQILQCAGSPYQVKQVNAWLKAHPDLKGAAAQEAASKEGFDASFVAIVLFPQVLQMMDDQPDWTRSLGQAFVTQRDAVFDSIQRLREQAQSVGNLSTTPQQTVDTVTTGNGQQVIVIQPANPQVVYVPQYDPQVVYTQPSTTTVVQQDDHSDAVAAGLIGFAAGVIVGAVADNDDDHYYYACGGWGYARPICYSGGYNDYYKHRENMANDYYNHRENMANDYYDHRENMAGQRGDNQSQRQDYRTDTRGAASQNQSARQQTRSDTRGTNQSSRQSAANQAQVNRGSATSRGSFQSGGAATDRSGMNSGAFSGFQRGSTERASSSRGRSSVSRSSGGSRGGGRRR